MRKPRNRNPHTRQQPYPKPLSKVISTNDAAECGVPSPVTSPCGNGGSDSDSTETFGYFKAEFSPPLSPEASINRQDDTKEDALHTKDKMMDYIQRKKGIEQLDTQQEIPLSKTDVHKEIKLETESLLQQVVFDELLEVLKVSNPQGSDTMDLSSHARNLFTPGNHKSMKAVLGSTILDEAYEAMVLWCKIHAKLHEFRRSTNYTGKAGTDWQAHKQTLSKISWREASLPAVVAHRRLGLFVEDLNRRGEWVAPRPDEFASRVACYYATLLQAPNVYIEDLVDGFQEYNVELLKWFQI
ncbi:hypothetical protein G6011_02797 [Alternaria panax]|uniref:Uncharacterized protein n=1 Tax=Alternaria panax TaxID=48097 RepID=A0AAD4FBI1_9PLEO|nr:hypothetical protein G6011_02797 [Alternaria panax]